METIKNGIPTTKDEENEFERSTALQLNRWLGFFFFIVNLVINKHKYSFLYRIIMMTWTIYRYLENRQTLKAYTATQWSRILTLSTPPHFHSSLNHILNAL